MPVTTLEEIRSRIGEEVGVSSWLTMDQQRIDEFADSTEDRQFIHIDPETAAQTPFGTTIAHGFLSLSMLSRMAAEAMLVPDTTKMALNQWLRLGQLTSGDFSFALEMLSSTHEDLPKALESIRTTRTGAIGPE